MFILVNIGCIECGVSSEEKANELATALEKVTRLARWRAKLL